MPQKLPVIINRSFYTLAAILKIIITISITIGVIISMLLAPTAALAAAVRAMNSWWANVVPSLLPFFICTEVLKSLGLINALGIWLTPIMRPLFHLPGAAALPLILGFFSGSPTAAIIVADLRRQELLTRNEAERLLAFTNNAGPLYIMLTVSCALDMPESGLLLALTHYPVNLLYGIILRFFANKDTANTKSANTEANPQTDTIPPTHHAKQNIMHGWHALSDSPPPLGVLLRDSSQKALQSIAMIGAFMLIFSLLLHALQFSGLLNLLNFCLLPLTVLPWLTPETIPALTQGLFEMTLGIVTLSESNTIKNSAITEIQPEFQLCTAAMILAWSGLSIHAQISGMISGTDIRLRYYLPCRLLHTIIAPAIMTLLLKHSNIPVSTNQYFSQHFSQQFEQQFEHLDNWQFLLQHNWLGGLLVSCLLLTICLLCLLIPTLLQRIKGSYKKL